jgi:cell wall-associated NlpC family hydrolase
MAEFTVKYLPLLIAMACSTLSASAQGKPSASPAEGKVPAAGTSSLKPEEIRGFARLPAGVQEILRYALTLTERSLGYLPGSADPDAGGTDCSGFVYHVLQRHGHIGAPRQSNEMYEWTWRAGTFRACNGRSMETFEFNELRPGDLLFWVNSTRDGKTERDPPVTHVMFYLGERASDGHRLAVGASDGRTYDGQRRCGVSVFDFRLPSGTSEARFIGYAHLPRVAVQPEKPAEKTSRSSPVEKPKAAAKKGSKSSTRSRSSR